MTRRKSGESGEGHTFGGDWTETKLAILRGYLAAYTKVMKNQAFRTGYIDAFAGTGYRTLRAANQPTQDSELLFPDLAAPDPQALLDGSARLALRIEPLFDRYIFIEKSEDRCRQLEGLRQEFPSLSNRIRVCPGDANTEIRKLCGMNWGKNRNRAVLFLDPYGMQVEWTTIEAIARTEAIDLWLLFPLGIGVNRLLPRTGDVPSAWRSALDRLLGCEDWYDAFYRVNPIENLFGEVTNEVQKEGIDAIGKYFVKRLKTVFPGVAEKPALLYNSANCPLYLFCFAVASKSKRAQGIALDIATSLLKG